MLEFDDERKILWHTHSSFIRSDIQLTRLLKCFFLSASASNPYTHTCKRQSGLLSRRHVSPQSVWNTLPKTTWGEPYTFSNITLFSMASTSQVVAWDWMRIPLSRWKRENCVVLYVLYTITYNVFLYTYGYTYNKWQAGVLENEHRNRRVRATPGVLKHSVNLIWKTILRGSKWPNQKPHLPTSDHHPLPTQPPLSPNVSSRSNEERDCILFVQYIRYFSWVYVDALILNVK